MSVEWGRLRVLDAVARTGSVTRAAVMLHMTGPAVSQQLRRIEAESGTTIVAPDGRGLRLTHEGRVLAGYARRLADLMQAADNDLHREGERVGHVRVAAIASIIRTLLSSRLPAFRLAHPRVQVSIDDGETVDHIERLVGGTVDVVLAESWSSAPLRLPEGTRAHRLAREPVYAVLPATHPRADRPHVEIDELADDAWTTCARGSDAHTALTQAARSRGIELDVRYYVADPSTQLALVRAGLAVACLPALDEFRRDPDLVGVPLLPETHRDSLFVVDSRPASLAVEEFAAHLLGPAFAPGVSRTGGG